ncbi:MAG: ribonuclease R [Firmicutes bacterium]|nr:ribonuclease R [Bacillota bacterium]
MDDRIFESRKQILLDLMNDKQYVPMKIKELAVILQVSREERPKLEQVLAALLEEGKIEINKRGKYKIAEETTVTGTFLPHPKGFGFVEAEGMEEDIFIPEEYTGNAFCQDMVQVVLIPGKNGKRREGRITAILSHTISEVVGTYEKSKNFGFVVPDNPKILQDIFVPIEDSRGAVNGHKVIVQITQYGSARRKPEGKIVKIIGHINDPGTDVLSVVYARELPFEFPEKVLNQAERVRDEVSEADMAGRMDLRSVPMVTIDGEDAKDLDDAVSLSREGAIWHLGVHIADVSNYVQENSALDREAKKRGTSVYLVDRVIPMLPHRLSNGICSLNEGCDRLALSCLMDIDERGNVTGSQIVESVICVDRRMTYTSVKKILEDRDEIEREKYQELVPMFEEMQKLAGILREKRRKRGSIDFDFPETKMILDKRGKPVDIKPYDRNVATKIIEDFMLIANETVAQEYFWRELPFVYRTHDTPDPEKIQALAEFIRNFGYGLKGVQDEIHPKELQKLLARIADSPEEMLISRLTLRSMKQARYSTECTGHFGLAAKYYCHFTSPIRRYPDLQIHRIIKENLRGRMNPERIAHYEEILPEVAEHSSKTERRADEAERETEKMKKAEYMQEHIGEIYEGVISGITSWGMYVELPSTVEGLIHVSNLYDDRYYYQEESHEMVGVDTGTVYKLGQSIQVRVLGADKQTRTIDFVPAAKEDWEDR